MMEEREGGKRAMRELRAVDQTIRTNGNWKTSNWCWSSAFAHKI